MAGSWPWWLCGTQVACAHRTSHGGSSSLALSPRVDVQPRWGGLILFCTSNVPPVDLFVLLHHQPLQGLDARLGRHQLPLHLLLLLHLSNQLLLVAFLQDVLSMKKLLHLVQYFLEIASEIEIEKMRISKPQCLVSRVLPSLPQAQF